MTFIQTIDIHTTKFDEINEIEQRWRAATEGKRTLRRSILTRDRNDPDHYVILAFFDSYESAMENSNLPETGEFGAQQAALADRPLQFMDLEVLAEEDG